MPHFLRRCILLSLTPLLAVVLVNAQSGRRTTKVNPAPVPMPTPAPSPKPKVNEPAKPALTFIVGIQVYVSYSFSEVVIACADRLEDSPSVKAVPVSGNMTRGDAVKRARREDEAYVVWMEIKTDEMAGVQDRDQIVLEYWVFEPHTAKLAASGRAYPSAYRTRGGIILNPRTSGVYGNYQLREAAREVAERILSALHHSIPPKTLPRPLTN